MTLTNGQALNNVGKAVIGIAVLCILTLIGVGTYKLVFPKPAKTTEITVTGSLYSTRDGRIVIKNDEGKMFILLENNELWRMEQKAAFGMREFTVTGELSKYQERDYLFPRSVTEPNSH